MITALRWRLLSVLLHAWGVFPWQALTLFTLNGWPAGSMFWVEMIQSPVMLGRWGTMMVLPPGPTARSASGMFAAVSATNAWAGGMRWGAPRWARRSG